MWALIVDGRVRELTSDDPAGRYHPSLQWIACPAGTAVGSSYDGSSFSAPPVAAAKGPRYVPLATIRERVTAAGKWDQFADALDALPAAKRWHLQTLQEGVASDDPDAIELLTSIGCDPTAILAE